MLKIGPTIEFGTSLLYQKNKKKIKFHVKRLTLKGKRKNRLYGIKIDIDMIDHL